MFKNPDKSIKNTRNYSFMLFVCLLSLVWLYQGVLHAGRGIAVRPDSQSGKGHEISDEIKLYDNSHALVIGVDQYRYLNKLHGAVRDATNVSKALKKRGFQVMTLINREATKNRITELIGDKLPNRLGPHDRVLVYFAGHGISSGQTERAMGYLMPVEGKSELCRSTGISMRELQAWFADYPCKHVMFIADACYSGLALSTRAAGLPDTLPGYLHRVANRPVRIALTAGGAGEEANEWRGEGLFTHFFLRGINGEADVNQDEFVTSYELAAFIKPNVAQVAMDEFRASQNPQVGRRGEGEFIFLSKSHPISKKGGRARPRAYVGRDAESYSGKIIQRETTAPLLKVYRFEKFPKGDGFSSWLAMKTERNLVELFSNAGVPVTSHATSRWFKSGSTYSLKGACVRSGDTILLSIELFDDKDIFIASAEIEGTEAYMKQVRKVIPETLVYMMDISPESFKPLKSKKRATASSEAFALYLLAKGHLRSEKTSDAINALKASVERDPKFALACWSLAQIYRKLGDPKQSESWNQKAMRIDPDHLRLPVFAGGKVARPIPELLKQSRLAQTRELEKGLAIEVIEVSEYGLKVYVWSVDSSAFVIKTAVQDNPRGNRIEEFFTPAAVLAINGGFFEMDDDYRLTSSGLLMVDGVINSPLSRNGGSGVISFGRNPGIHWSKDIRDPGLFDYALQSGPVIIEKGGRMGIYSNDFNRLNRAAICQCDETIKFVVVVGQGGSGLSLFELASFLRSKEKDGGLGCDFAINLDGGPSTQALLRTHREEFTVEGLWRVHNAIIVERGIR